ncbi:hypothetical protein MBBTH_21630 [Methanobrevibacter thaueri]|uniref:Uncharacterized protein n=1 Tax=Methanobrevibacter thaueri TaxID=190975 RepID=A0A315XJC1_9EURY|nr:hypothetical protein MBBTH_21630 [Methanobrevibacter thaueri]
MSSVLTNRQANNQFSNFINNVHSVIVSADFNNHFTTGYISHSHSNGHVLTNSGIHNRNNNTINHSIVFEDSECLCSAVSIILAGFVNCSSDSVVTCSQCSSVYYDFTVNNWIFNTINSYVNSSIVLNSNSEVSFNFIIIIYSNIHTGSMFYNFKYCTVECSVIVISFSRSCNNSVITNNISIKGVITICVRSVDHTINSNNNRS